MPSSTLLDPPVGDTGSGPPSRPPGGGGGDGGGGERPPHEGGAGDGGGAAALLGVWVALVPVTMLFAAMAVAYLARGGAAHGGVTLSWPPVLLLNTGVLLASSAALEAGRSRLARGREPSSAFWAAFALGVLFLAGQGVAWRQILQATGSMQRTLTTAFFFLLTLAHAIHVLGGVVGLGIVARCRSSVGGLSRALVARVAAVYWHFMAVLWIGIFVLLRFHA